MVKMEVIFKNGLAVSDLTRLHNLIKKCGGEGVFMPLKNIEAQNTSDNNARDEICAQIIESDDVCKYCKNDRGDNSTCYSAAIDCSCFIGRKLSPVA